MKHFLRSLTLLLLVLPTLVFASEYEIFQAEVLAVTSEESISVKPLKHFPTDTLELSTINLNADTQRTLKKGDRVLVENYRENTGEQNNYSVVDLVRNNQLFVLLGIFIITVLAVVGKKGFMSLVTLILSFYVIFYFTINQIIAGQNPLPISLATILIIVPLNFYLTHGFKKKTTAAVISTFITLFISIGLAEIFINWARLTGNTTEEGFWVTQDFSAITSLQGLLSAAIIIGLVGILDDITINQTAVVQELYDSSKNTDPKHVRKRAMSIGRDHISSMINTLILVYASASLPLFILLSQDLPNLQSLISLETVSEEIIRILIASIGVIIAVPISTMIAVKMLNKDTHAEKNKN